MPSAALIVIIDVVINKDKTPRHASVPPLSMRGEFFYGKEILMV